MDMQSDSRASTFIRNLNEKYRSWSDLSRVRDIDGYSDSITEILREKIQNDDESRREQEEELDQLQQSLKDKTGIGIDLPPSGRSKALYSSGDSGFSQRSTKSHLSSDDQHQVRQTQTSPVIRSCLGGSMNGLNGVKNVDTISWRIQHALKESETRREQLVQRLKEAHDIIKVQSDKMVNLEYSMKDNSFEVDDLKFREKEARNKLIRMEKERNEYQAKMLECYRQKEELQEKCKSIPLKIMEFHESSKQMVANIDKQLDELKMQQALYEGELFRKQDMLEKTTASVMQLQDQNSKLQATKDSLQREMGVLKDTVDISRRGTEKLESDLSEAQADRDEARRENRSLSSQNKERAKKIEAFDQMTGKLKDECSTLIDGYRSLNEEKQRLLGEQSSLQITLRDEAATAVILQKDKERLLAEIVALNNRIKAIAFEQEKLEKGKMAIENQNIELHNELTSLGNELEHRNDEITSLEEQLDETQKECEALSKELATTKILLEQEQDRCASIEKCKSLLQQRFDTQEKLYNGLGSQGEMLRKELLLLKKQLEEERDKVQEAEERYKDEARRLKLLQNTMDDKCEEHGAIMRKTDKEVESWQRIHDEEIHRWKNTCQKLTETIAEQETELHDVKTAMQELREQNILFKVGNESHQGQYEQLVEAQNSLEKLHTKNRRLEQTCEENQQVIQLLEMQKNLLSKSSRGSSDDKDAEIDQLRISVDRLTAENQLLQGKFKDVARVKDNLISQKETLLTDSFMLYDKQSSRDQLTQKLQETKKENLQLKMSVQISMERLTLMEKENMELKYTAKMRSDTVPKALLDRCELDNKQLEKDLSQVHDELAVLERRYHALLRDQGKQKSNTATDMTEILKERDEQQSKLTLLTGEAVLMENNKKRLEQRVDLLEAELQRCKACMGNSAKGDRFNVKMEGDLEALKRQLMESKESQEKQQRILQSLKLELGGRRLPSFNTSNKVTQSLEDLSSELIQMRKELHRLLEIIQSKDRAIQDIEGRLRNARDEQITKENEIRDLKGRVYQMTSESSQSLKALEEKLKSVQGERDELSRNVESLKLRENDYNRRLTEAKNQRNIALKDAADLREGMQDLKVIFEEEKRQVRSSLEEQIQLKDRHITELKEKLRKAMEDLIKYKSEARKCEILHFFPKTNLRQLSDPRLSRTPSERKPASERPAHPIPLRFSRAPTLSDSNLSNIGAKGKKGRHAPPSPLSLSSLSSKIPKSNMEDVRAIAKSAPPIKNTDETNPEGVDSVYNSMDVESPNSPKMSVSGSTTPVTDVPDDSGCDETRSPDDVECTACDEVTDVVDAMATSNGASSSSKIRRGRVTLDKISQDEIMVF
ncbi:early endosome antigen 1-like isoform X2 [Lineus longissimus]|uniref:early endosome antigen 1-like isoform X2 n=1 Tax=Lineus longissimus TaxID=88925 RepID=UPI00315CE5E4